jgi:hypothetical protein
MMTGHIFGHKDYSPEDRHKVESNKHSRGRSRGTPIYTRPTSDEEVEYK